MVQWWLWDFKPWLVWVWCLGFVHHTMLLPPKVEVITKMQDHWEVIWYWVSALKSNNDLASCLERLTEFVGYQTGSLSGVYLCSSILLHLVPFGYKLVEAVWAKWFYLHWFRVYIMLVKISFNVLKSLFKVKEDQPRWMRFLKINATGEWLCSLPQHFLYYSVLDIMLSCWLFKMGEEARWLFRSGHVD